MKSFRSIPTRFIATLLALVGVLCGIATAQLYAFSVEEESDLEMQYEQLLDDTNLFEKAWYTVSYFTVYILSDCWRSVWGKRVAKSSHSRSYSNVVDSPRYILFHSLKISPDQHPIPAV